MIQEQAAAAVTIAREEQVKQKEIKNKSLCETLA